MQTQLLLPIILSPFIGFVVIGLFGKRMTARTISVIACGVVGISAAIAFTVFLRDFLPLDPSHRLLTQHVYRWIAAGSFLADFGLILDPLSCVMLLFVTGVGFLIHIFATGYMRGDDGYYRFFAYMNLFMFAMLTLILADNFLLMFVGWEGVGLCSYLLIGYYLLKKEAGDAAKKAFIVNRIGDAGFVIGVSLLFLATGSVSFLSKTVDGVQIAGVFEQFQKISADPLWVFGAATAIALFLFVGAVGKSAQIPLFVWLPDAMAGPTPVSALIHAATMVTAGVYMVSRCSPIFAKSPTAMLVVALTGGFTAIFAATIAIGQWDIKKVLAYSTVSQLGYMFLACGAGAWAGGIFHVMTHSFFKALLFLGAGSVIHAMHHEQDMRRMGGLKKFMPVTCATMIAAWLAISGVPMFSGFFSKDEILYRTFTSKAMPPFWAHALWFIGLLTALLTAIYMTRLMVVTFWGERREGDAHTAGHAHEDRHSIKESPRVMTIPLIVLAVLSVAGGWIGVPKAFTGGKDFNVFEHFLSPAVASSPMLEDHQYVAPPSHEIGLPLPAETTSGAIESAAIAEAGESGEESHGAEWALALVSSLVALAGIGFGWIVYRRNPLWKPPSILEHKYWIDEIYDAAIISPIKNLSTSFLWRIFDAEILDGIVNGTGSVVASTGRAVRFVQTGVMRMYVFLIACGALAVIGYFLWNS